MRFVHFSYSTVHPSFKKFRAFFMRLQCVSFSLLSCAHSTLPLFCSLSLPPPVPPVSPLSSPAPAGSTLVIATNQADILVVGNVNADSAPEIVHSGHHDGELWAVAPHPDAATGLFASVGEDNKLIVWDAERHSAVKVAPISTEPGVARRKVVRAATTSSAATNHCARAIAYSPDAKHLAVGTNEGKCCVYDAKVRARWRGQRDER
jgi:WD40 repeat protein